VTPFSVCCLLGGAAVLVAWFLPFAQVEFEVSARGGARTITGEWSFSRDLTLLSAAVFAAGLGLIAVAVTAGSGWPSFALASACAIVLSVVVVNTFANDPSDTVLCESGSVPQRCAGAVLGSAIEDLYERRIEGRSEIEEIRVSSYDADGRFAYLLLALIGLPLAVLAPYRLVRLRLSQGHSALVVGVVGLAALVVAYLYMVVAALG
jgi:hypothetical protein